MFANPFSGLEIGHKIVHKFATNVVVQQNSILERKWLKLLTVLVSVALTDAVKATDTNWASIIACLCL